MRIRILYHDHCFDGAASAAFFSRFMEDKFHPGAEFLYTGMAHQAVADLCGRPLRWRRERDRRFQVLGQPEADVVVRPSPERVSVTRGRGALATDQDREEALRPEFPVLHAVHLHGGPRQWSYDAADLHELVHWAEIIDGALYASAQGSRRPWSARHAVDAGDRGIEGLRYGAADHPAGCGRCRWPRSCNSRRFRRSTAPLYERHLRSIGHHRGTSRRTIRGDLLRSGGYRARGL